MLIRKFIIYKKMKRCSIIVSLLFLSFFLGYSSVSAAPGSEDYSVFLKKFTTSASFQYSRIKFPLKSDIVLSLGDGEGEKSFPFTRREWPLLDEEAFVEERNVVEGEGTFVAHYTIKQPAHVEFEAGYEESEPDLKVCFDLVNGKWFVTDCYTSWYNFNVLANELNKTVLEVQKENKEFIKDHP